MNNDKAKKCYSGIYPSLAVTNGNGTECGIGALASFGGKLYFITYAASCARGSDDGLYILDKDLNLEKSEKSVGGTPANRFIHEESGQLVIGCYFIDKEGNIRTIDPKKLVGRLTSASYSLDEHEKYVYINTMEDGIYKVNVETLEFTTLRFDRYDLLYNEPERMRLSGNQLPGEHAKGGYVGQGVYVTTNNGIGGALLEWDGKGDPQRRESWNIIDNNKYTEVITADGVNGNFDQEKPLWALGWDKASVLLNVKTKDGWTRFRLPKASYTQDADHGWYTEWPRIRKVGGRYLMCMHGMFWEFPENFSPEAMEGLKPLSRHLKMVADFEDFGGKIVFACDDASVMGNPECGRSESNLWFSDNETIDNLSDTKGFGGAAVHKGFEAGEATEPFYIGGFKKVIMHIQNENPGTTNYHIEGLKTGNIKDFIKIGETGIIEGYKWIDLSECGCDWIRVRAGRNCADTSIYFHLSNEAMPCDEKLVAALHKTGSSEPYSKGQLYTLEGEDMLLGYKTEDGYYTWNGTDEIEKCDNAPEVFLKTEPKHDVKYLENSVMIIDHLGIKRHLPIAEKSAFGREIREVVTERNLLNAGGTIYELPRDDSMGAMKLKPVTSHGLDIYDFNSFRGLLILSGVDKNAEGEHIVDGSGEKLWAGNVDDLWKFGSPYGKGGATVNTHLYPNEAGEPYLFYGYKERSVTLSHDSDEDVTFTLEADYMGDGTYGVYKTFLVKPGEKSVHEFPEEYEAHWMRVRINREAKATALFSYK